MSKEIEALQSNIDKLSKENFKITQDCLDLKTTVQTLIEENETIKKESERYNDNCTALRNKVESLESTLFQCQQELNTYHERQSTILTELNRLKETVMDSNNLLKQTNQISTPQPSVSTTQVESTAMTLSSVNASSMRIIPAPSKVMVNDQKRKDNRLIELKRITQQHMKVSEEEASLRLYKLQKTMVHVLSDLKEYMIKKNEDVNKSWKWIDISTQRVAFDMVEREATNLGVPLNLCIGYWGARRLISKSWANTLRTTKKCVKSENSSIGAKENDEYDNTPENTNFDSFNFNRVDDLSDPTSSNENDRDNKKQKLDI